MEFRVKERTLALLILLGPVLGAQELRYQVWHGHPRPPNITKSGSMGSLSITEAGIAFDELRREGKKQKHPHVWHWDYQDIQQLKIAPKSLTVLTYQDNRWKLGADREYVFDLRSEETFDGAYDMLKHRLDQRFVSAIPDRLTEVLWEIPVKHLLRFGGDQGVLQVGPREIVYRSAKRRESRTWRFEDIDNISTSGPFQLTVTTFERAKTHYGDRKGFNFQLKQPLDEARYNHLWLRLNHSKGLQILESYRAGAR